MPESFRQIEEELRRAVLEHNYAEVQNLAVRFAEAAEADARSGNAASTSRLSAQVQDALRWAITQLLSERNRLSSQLQQLRSAKRYFSRPPSNESVVRFDG